MKKGISIGIIVLFIVSAVSPMVIGYKSDAVSEIAGEVKPESIVVSGPMDSPWPMYKHDPQHTGRSPYDTGHNNGGERWKFEALGPIESSAAIDKDGTIYFASEDDKLHAVYKNGTEKWNCTISEMPYSSPALATDETIYIASEGSNGKVYAVNPNGTIKWRFKPQEFFFASPTIGEDGTIYIGSVEGKLYALYPDNGTLKWKFDAGKWAAIRSPAINENGIIFVTSINSNLYALYPNGTLKWTFDTPGLFYSSPVIGDDGTIYITPNCGLLYAVNPDGSEKWQAEMTSSYLGTPALGPDGTIYVPCNFNDLIAVNPQGSIKWIFTLTEKPEAIYSTPSVGNDGTIYIGCDEHLFAINPDGTIKWKTRLTSDRHPYDKCHIVASPAIAEDGTIYISTWFLSGGSGVTDWGYLHAIGGVKIQQPEQGNLYLFGKRIIKTLLGNTIIIGPIDVQVSLFKEDIERVDFYVDWILKSTDTTSPFNWTWDLRSLIRHRHTIEVVAYDEDGEWAHDRMNVWKFL